MSNWIDFVQAEARYHHAYHGKFHVSEVLSLPLTKNPVGRQANKESAGYFNKLCSYIESEKEVYSLQGLQVKMIEVPGGENEYIKFIQRNGLTQFRMGFFGAAHRWGGPFWPTLPKIRHTCPTMMKLGTVISYQRKIQKIYKSRDEFLEFCWHQHFFTGNEQILLHQEAHI